MLREIMEGRASEVQTAGFLIALRAKGETVRRGGRPGPHDARAGRARGGERRHRGHCRHRRRALDLQRLHHRRLRGRRAPAAGWPSTAGAPTPASAAPPTCSRHWARASIPPPEEVAACVEEVGFGFMFAPAHHGAMKHVAPVRRELAVRTAFNLLGPLTNPAGARRQVIGVSEPRFLETVAGALAELGTERALVVSSEDGFDEFSASGGYARGGGGCGCAAQLHGHAGARRPGARRQRGGGRGHPETRTRRCCDRCWRGRRERSAR